MSVPVRLSHLHHASFLRPREPAFWVFAGVVALGAIQIVDVLVGLSEISRSGWALSWLLLALYAAPVAVLIYRLDLYEREPVPVLVAALAWGAFAAPALVLQAAGWDQVVAQVFGADFATRWGQAIDAPLVEETVKGAGIVLLYLIVRDEFDDVMDGFVYGALVGLGFTVVEDVLYFMAVFGGTPAGVFHGFYVRVLSSGLYGHVLYSGLVGMAIGVVVSHRVVAPLGRRLGVAAALTGAAVFGHALWNSPLLNLLPPEPVTGAEWLLVPLAFAVKGLPLLAFVVLAIWLAHGRERRWIDGSLANEVGRDGVSSAEMASLRTPRRRREAVRTMRIRAGPKAADLLKRLQREQVNLAMIVDHAALPEDPAVIAQRAFCRSLRDALQAIPGAAPAEPPPAGDG